MKYEPLQKAHKSVGTLSKVVIYTTLVYFSRVYPTGLRTCIHRTRGKYATSTLMPVSSPLCPMPGTFKAFMLKLDGFTVCTGTVCKHPVHGKK